VGTALTWRAWGAAHGQNLHAVTLKNGQNATRTLFRNVRFSGGIENPQPFGLRRLDAAAFFLAVSSRSLAQRAPDEVRAGESQCMVALVLQYLRLYSYQS